MEWIGNMEQGCEGKEQHLWAILGQLRWCWWPAFPFASCPAKKNDAIHTCTLAIYTSSRLRWVSKVSDISSLVWKQLPCSAFWQASELLKQHGTMQIQGQLGAHSRFVSASIQGLHASWRLTILAFTVLTPVAPRHRCGTEGAVLWQSCEHPRFRCVTTALFTSLIKGSRQCIWKVKQDATQPRFTFLRISVHGQQSWWLPSNMLADIVGQRRRSLRASAWSFVWLEAIIAMPCIDAHKKRINMDQHGLSSRETMWPCHWWNAMMSILEQSWKIHKHPMNGCWRRYWGAWFFEQLFESSKLFNRWWVWFLWVQCKHKLNNYKNQEGEHRRTRK